MKSPILLSVLLPFILAQADLLESKNYCEGVECGIGEECDSLNGECVAVSCDAVNPCPLGEICIPNDDIQCIRAPCPKFTCEVYELTCATILCMQGYFCDEESKSCLPVTCEAPDACKEGEICVDTEFECVENQYCPQFECKDDHCKWIKCKKGYKCVHGKCVRKCHNKCDMVRCKRGYECNRELEECVPVNCMAETACDEGQFCVDVPHLCFDHHLPCPQFTCKDPEECVVCTLMLPSCDESCEKCEILPQTCDQCVRAVCVDSDPDCVVCPQVIPQCEAGCKHHCEITPQSCHHCSYATCVKNLRA